MAISISHRAERIVQAEIRAMSVECERVGGINLAQGVCDTEVPAIVRKGAQDAMEAGINSYTRFDGLATLRTAIAEKLKAFNGITADPETQITVSAGSTGSFYCACLALLNPGDEVVLFEPYYGYHLNTLLAAELSPVYVNMRPPEWQFDIAELRAAITPRTRAIMINSPGNPSGKVFTRSELRSIAAVAEEHDLLIFTDEIYEYILYDGLKHISPGALPEMAHRTVTISGFSKTFSITGWRIGYSVAPEKLAKMIGYLNDLIYVCAPAPLQMGVAAGIRGLGADFYANMQAEYQHKRDKLCLALQQSGLTPYRPQGAYYILADVSRLPGQSSKEKAMHLLRTTGIATVPGDSFFSRDQGRNLTRFCFAKTQADIDEACQRLARLNVEVPQQVGTAV
jgi:aminotransferase